MVEEWLKQYPWLKEQYGDIKGNLKWAIMVLVLGGIVTTFHYLIGGLPLWRQLCIGVLFSTMAIWCAIATWKSRRFDQLAENEKEHPSQLPLNLPFSTDQLQAVSLANDLGKLLESIEPRKILKSGDFPDTEEGQVEFMTANSLAAADYRNKFSRVIAKYALELAPRVRQVVLRFAQEGYTDVELRQFVEQVSTQDQLVLVRARLICLAYEPAGILLTMRKTNS